MISVSNQYRIFGLHHHQIFHAYGGHQTGLGVDIAIFSLVADNVAVMHIAIRIFITDLPQRGPGADVAPARIHRNHNRIGGFFHNRVVDGLIRAVQEGLLINSHKIKIRSDIRYRLFTGRKNVGAEFRQFFKIPICSEQEHAAVPVIFTAGDIGLCGAKVRFFNEFGDFECSVFLMAGNCNSPTNIPVPRLRLVWDNTKRNELAGFSIGYCTAHRITESVFILNHMIGRKH